MISESPSLRPSASAGAGALLVTLTLLDGFELRRRDEPVPLPLGCQRVVAFLALHRRPLTRVHVAGMLWIDVSEARSCGNLRSALWRIRQRCGPLVETTSTHLSLARELIVDVDTVLASTRRVLGGDTVCEAELEEACAPGELLPDWYDDWLEPERERLRQLRLHALEAAAERLLESGRAPHAIDALLVALRDEPLRESLHRLLIRAHLVEGNAAEAIRCYRAYRRRLNTTLGLAPSAHMDAVLGGLLAVR